MWVWMRVGCTVGIATLGSEIGVPFPAPTVSSGCPLAGAGLGSGTGLQACPGAAAGARKVTGAWTAAQVQQMRLVSVSFSLLLGSHTKSRLVDAKPTASRSLPSSMCVGRVCFSKTCVLCSPRL